MRRIIFYFFLLFGYCEVQGQNVWSENGNIGLGTLTPTNKLNIMVGAGTEDGTVALKIGSIGNYPTLELGVQNDYNAQIRTYGNDLNLYAGHFRTIGNVSSESHQINFYTSKNGSTNWSVPKMVLNHDGNVGIGTSTPQEKLSVNGNIRAREIKVETANWPDYVFEEDYKITSLQDLEKYIKANKHLPDMPSAKEVESNGLVLGELVKQQQKKIEELTLHLIEKDNELNKINKRIENIEEENMQMKPFFNAR
ncbi:hypothetical protein [Pedobacter sp. MW01-1-1]|uniref:hypothetical protein n=1 Tax=Pedobacter sp. MW01-1-1 TaxID=3383027 RepID=UPI003FF112B5